MHPLYQPPTKAALAEYLDREQIVVDLDRHAKDIRLFNRLYADDMQARGIELPLNDLAIVPQVLEEIAGHIRDLRAVISSDEWGYFSMVLDYDVASLVNGLFVNRVFAKRQSQVPKIDIATGVCEQLAQATAIHITSHIYEFDWYSSDCDDASHVSVAVAADAEVHSRLNLMNFFRMRLRSVFGLGE